MSCLRRHNSIDSDPVLVLCTNLQRHGDPMSVIGWFFRELVFWFPGVLKEFGYSLMFRGAFDGPTWWYFGEPVGGCLG
jgi:hypothetical protein